MDASALCISGVALGDIDVHPAWQAWDLVTSTFVSGGRRGTSGTGLALVAGLVPSGRRGRRGSLRGRRGTRRHGRASCVAGVHLGASAAANAIAALKIQNNCSRNQQTLSISSASSGEPAEVVK